MGIEIGQDKTDKQADRQNSSQVDSGNGIKCLNDDIKQIQGSLIQRFGTKTNEK